MHFVKRLLPLLLLVACQAQEPTDPPGNETEAPTGAPWNGCVDPNDPSAPAPVTIGEKTFICLVLTGSADWGVAAPKEYLRLTFSPTADQYSRFHVPNCTYLLVGCSVLRTGTFLSFSPVFLQRTATQRKNGRITLQFT